MRCIAPCRDILFDITSQPQRPFVMHVVIEIESIRYSPVPSSLLLALSPFSSGVLRGWTYFYHYSFYPHSWVIRTATQLGTTVTPPVGRSVILGISGAYYVNVWNAVLTNVA